MKDTVSWNPPNTGATNSSGFSGLAAGAQLGAGAFGYLKNYAFWWTSTSYNGTAWSAYLNYNNSIANRGGHITNSYGFSVRCVRN